MVWRTACGHFLLVHMAQASFGSRKVVELSREASKALEYAGVSARTRYKTLVPAHQAPVPCPLLVLAFRQS